MNACPTFLATPTALVASLIYRIVAFVALCIRASGLGATHATTAHSGARIVAFAVRVVMWAGNVARLATRPVRYVGGGDGTRQAGDADPGIVAPQMFPALAGPSGGLCQKALPRRVLDRALPTGRVDVSIASDGKHRRPWPIRSTSRTRAQ